jgi:hypothetical protein
MRQRSGIGELDGMPALIEHVELVEEGNPTSTG